MCGEWPPPRASAALSRMHGLDGEQLRRLRDLPRPEHVPVPHCGVHRFERAQLSFDRPDRAQPVQLRVPSARLHDRDGDAQLRLDRHSRFGMHLCDRRLHRFECAQLLGRSKHGRWKLSGHLRPPWLQRPGRSQFRLTRVHLRRLVRLFDPGLHGPNRTKLRERRDDRRYIQPLRVRCPRVHVCGSDQLQLARNAR